MTYIQNKGQYEDESTSQKINIFSFTTMIAKHLTLTCILTCCQLTLIYCPFFCIVLAITSVILKSKLH